MKWLGTLMVMALTAGPLVAYAHADDAQSQASRDGETAITAPAAFFDAMDENGNVVPPELVDLAAVSQLPIETPDEVSARLGGPVVVAGTAQVEASTSAAAADAGPQLDPLVRPRFIVCPGNAVDDGYVVVEIIKINVCPEPIKGYWNGYVTEWANDGRNHWLCVPAYQGFTVNIPVPPFVIRWYGGVPKPAGIVETGRYANVLGNEPYKTYARNCDPAANRDLAIIGTPAPTAFEVSCQSSACQPPPEPSGVGAITNGASYNVNGDPAKDPDRNGGKVTYIDGVPWGGFATFWAPTRDVRYNTSATAYDIAAAIDDRRDPKKPCKDQKTEQDFEVGGKVMLVVDPDGNSEFACITFITADPDKNPAIRDNPAIKPGDRYQYQQINFIMPNGFVDSQSYRIGLYDLRKATFVAMGLRATRRVQPSLFSANSSGTGPAAAQHLRVAPDNSQTWVNIAEYDTNAKTFVHTPIAAPGEGENIFLILYGEGLRFRNTDKDKGVEKERVLVSLIGPGGTVELASAYATTAAENPVAGLDQVNVRLDASVFQRFAGQTVKVRLKLVKPDGKLAVTDSWSNPVTVQFA